VYRSTILANSNAESAIAVGRHRLAREPSDDVADEEEYSMDGRLSKSRTACTKFDTLSKTSQRFGMLTESHASVDAVD
jgi:hypothetical protein